MSEENKTGENLVEQVEQETVETKNESGFDPKTFMSTDVAEKAEEIKDEKPKEETKVEPEEEGDGFKWNSVETETETKEQAPEDVDWDSTPESKDKPEVKETETKPAEVDWVSLAKELGVEAKDKESLKAAVTQAMKPEPKSETLDTLKGYLKMTDRDLVLADLKASGMEEMEAKETLVRIEDSGLLKREATQARKQINDFISNESDRLRKVEKERVAQQRREDQESRASLQSYLKEKEDFFGGKINNTEKKDLYQYIVSGEFAKEVYGNHANVADAAFLWKYKDKIFKMLQGQGMEKGKAAVLNKITNPDLGRRSRNVDTTKGDGFDPTEFLK
jgi:hypothetical protein